MKILKINKIDNFGIFNNFNWDSSLKYKNPKGEDEIYDFKDINIFYGRNYSGKTSLSKIIRSLETKNISDKYDNPSFEIMLNDSTVIKNSELSKFRDSIHVYNSDFVKDNLKFIYDDTQDLKPFTVTLGNDNQEILDRISILKSELGVNEENNISGIYSQIELAKQEKSSADNTYKNAQNTLDVILQNRSTSDKDSIRNSPEKYGDQNYTVKKLKEIDIPKVLKQTYQPLEDDTRNKYELLIDLKSKRVPNEIRAPNINFEGMSKSVEEILQTEVGQSEKINELVNNGALNKWVEDGLKYHAERTKCAFCASDISQERLQALRQHFDEEFRKLNDRIVKGIDVLESSKSKLNISIKVDEFYDVLHDDLRRKDDSLTELFKEQENSINSLIKLLEDKKQSLFNKISFQVPIDYTENIKNIVAEIELIRQKHINQTETLEKDKRNAQNALRLDHVYSFVQQINYVASCEAIMVLEQKIKPLDDILSEKKRKEQEILDAIKSEEDKLQSESEACARINGILNHDFGHPFLKLEAKEINGFQGKSIVFEVQRNGKKAHNLSEGECSLISFCYFLVKIREDLNQGKQPIIWIDDPISSLDSNHIFFIYSLIEQYICQPQKYQQLFISTHSLEFLKYLRRIKGVETDNSLENISEHKRKTGYYLIQRNDTHSIIKKMPLYLSKFITEFNFLFEQIYQCATIQDINDENYHIFYNFANNARKFIEIYTFYKFPSPSTSDQISKEFWGDDLHKIIINRVNNEYSHMCGVFERGELLIDKPEMTKVANAIITKVQGDIKQYDALLESIGLNKTSDSLYPLNAE